MKKKPKTILVTGGAGFIGSHLVEKLLADPNNLVCALDNLSTGSLANLKNVQQWPNFKFVRGNILDCRVFRKIPRPDTIFHLAAAVGAKLVIAKPLESFRTNIIGTENVLNFALKSGAKILITSSSEVYGKNINIPFREIDDRIYGSVYNLRWGYALSKSCDELMAISHYRESKLPVVVVRLFNTIGPRQTGSYGMVVPNFVKQALENKPLTVYGDGKQIRTFTDVQDVVGVLIQLIREPKAVGKIFNIGSDNTISIKSLALLIKKLTNSRSPLKFIPYARAYSRNFEEMMKRKPDLAVIKKVVHYRPSSDLVKTLKTVIEDVKK